MTTAPLDVWWATTLEAGACSFCTGSKYDRVLVVRKTGSGRRLEINFCPSCLKQLRMRGGGHTVEMCRQRVMEGEHAS